MNNRSGLLPALTAIILFIVLESLSIVLVMESGVVQRFRIMGALRNTQAWVWTRTSNISHFFQYRTENERLAAENLMLQQQLAEARIALQSVDSCFSDADFSYIGAHVIKNTVNQQRNQLILDRGSRDGVEPGMGVVTPCGAIGIVSAVSPRYCYVISMLGTGQTVSAKLAGSGAFGPMVWPGTDPDQMLLQEIPVHIQAAPGDTVLTSGFSTIFPPDIPLGSVVESKVSKGSSQELTIRLFEEFRALHYVYIVKNNHRQEIESLYESVP